MSDEPRIGDVWADNDPRYSGRTFRIDRFERDVAICTVLTDRDDTPEDLSALHGRRLRAGKTTRIRTDRLRDIASGYRLLRRAEDG